MKILNEKDYYNTDNHEKYYYNTGFNWAMHQTTLLINFVEHVTAIKFWKLNFSSLPHLLKCELSVTLNNKIYDTLMETEKYMLYAYLLTLVFVTILLDRG